MVNLSQLLNLIEGVPEYRQLITGLQQKDSRVKTLVLEAAKSYLLAALFRTLNLPFLVITARDEEAKKLYEQLQVWGQAARIKLLAEPDAMPYQRVAWDVSTELGRLEVLSSLAARNTAPLVIASIPALMQKTTPYKDFVSTIHTVKLRDSIDPYKLLRRWEAMGYRPEHTVEVPGAMSHRGGIVDIYPPTGTQPVRIEFFGNIVDSIRYFDAATQRSQATIDSVTIFPAVELLSPFLNKPLLESILKEIDLSAVHVEVAQQFHRELSQLLDGQKPPGMQFYTSLFNTGSILDYLPPGTVVVLDESQSIAAAATDFEAKAEELREDQIGRGELPHNFPQPHFNWSELETNLNHLHQMELLTWESGEDETILRVPFTPAPTYAGQLPAFITKVKQLLVEQKRVIITSYQSGRLSELLAEQEIIASPTTEIKQPPTPSSLTLVQGSLSEGWIMNDAYIFSDSEIFGFSKEQRLTQKRPVAHRQLFAELIPGSYVVHIEHGIAKFTGVTTTKTGDREKEYLVLKYAAGDRLLVPLDQIDRVERYIGASDRPPVLSRLGTQEWLNTKKKIKESAEKVARELLALYATREIVPGFAYSSDTVWQQEMEASFPYVETPDQLAVQKEVKADMEKSRPMDRLVCGDVGYGKTEVALRAAFKAVMDGKQVAVLVPTTVLAEQHFNTFPQRFEAFPVKVDVLSRFRKPKEQKAVLEGLVSGSIDICIGTHRLLQKDVTFKNLGLLIIDEEQRFGVAHKEYLKKMRQEVDVLTLSATPIPRTLNMALAGVRDMSVMETPPEDRLPIKTYVAEFEDRLVREAILRELERSGQVFFVHNRVQGIGQIAQKIRALVPEARIAVAHGQMGEEALSRVMSDFSQDKYDVLVCTTIIESGLDLPRVNTIIINRADHFGLTQLYQLRGRVGRGSNLAYAYFLYDRQKQLTPIAEKRLRTIYQATELGAGFGVAMKDLEIRGAGNVLGVKQSGFIHAVGFNLYTRLLAEAVQEIKAKRGGAEKPPQPRLPPPTIDLHISSYIPEDYVSDLSTRLSLYQTLVNARNSEEAESVAQEIRDRFGPLPPETVNLLYVVKLRTMAVKGGIETIASDDGHVILRRFEGMRFNTEKLASFWKDGVELDPLQVRLSTRRGHWRELLEEIVKKV